MKRINNLMDNISEFVSKCNYLNSEFNEVDAFNFYRDIFPVGSFERKGNLEDKKPNAIVTFISKDRKKERSKSTIVFDDLKGILDASEKEFAITNCISYSGRNRTSKNAYSLYGITIDLDYVTERTLADLVFQMQGGVLPMATYLVNSGNGIHVYYVFNEPIPLKDWVVEPLNNLKKALTDKVWNQYTSIEKNKQYQNIYQGFRVIGSQTKLGSEYLVKAYKTGYKTDIATLNEFVSDPFKFDYENQKESRLTIDVAMNKYPEWYQSKVVEKRAKKHFIYNQGMYLKWIDYIKSGGFDGNRYHCLCVLFSNAIKCGISKDVVMQDAYDLLPILNEMTKYPDNDFTEKDLIDASAYFNPKSHMLKANTIRYKTKIDLPIGKRNGRKQSLHLKGARAIQQINDEANGTNWRDGNGRKSKQEQVQQWKLENPNSSKYQCQKELGISKNTVKKWW